MRRWLVTYFDRRKRIYAKVVEQGETADVVRSRYQNLKPERRIESVIEYSETTPGKSATVPSTEEE